MGRNHLLRILTMIQNSTEFREIDLLSVADKCDDVELENCILSNFARLSERRKVSIVEFTRELSASIEKNDLNNSSAY